MIHKKKKNVVDNNWQKLLERLNSQFIAFDFRHTRSEDNDKQVNSCFLIFGEGKIGQIRKHSAFKETMSDVPQRQFSPNFRAAVGSPERKASDVVEEDGASIMVNSTK